MFKEELKNFEQVDEYFFVCVIIFFKKDTYINKNIYLN